MASTTLHVAVPRARAVASRARRGGMPPARPASRRGVRCAAGEEVPLGVQIETALMDAFAPRFVGDRARAHPERPLSTRRLETAASRHPNPPREVFFCPFPTRYRKRVRPRRAPRLTRRPSTYPLFVASRRSRTSLHVHRHTTIPYDAIPYNSSLVTRVRDSLRFTLADDTYRKTHPGLGDQVASSYVAGLSAFPYWDARGGAFPWMEFLEQNYETIRDELREALRDPLLEQKGNAIWVAAARDDAEGYGPDWRTLVLQDRCAWEPSNVALFPKTTALVREANTPSVEVFFAKQAPKTGIKPHTDFTNFIMTAHLGLDVPPPPESWMKVGDETRYWENGIGMCADTSFIHSTFNESATIDRYVLIVRFWHPELTLHERNGVRFLFDAFEDLSPEGLARARDAARAREAADAAQAAEPGGEVAAEASAAEAQAPKKAGGRKKNKRNKRKAASGSGDGLGLLAKGMK